MMQTKQHVSIIYHCIITYNSVYDIKRLTYNIVRQNSVVVLAILTYDVVYDVGYYVVRQIYDTVCQTYNICKKRTMSYVLTLELAILTYDIAYDIVCFF